MSNILKIILVLILFNTNSKVSAVETIDKIKKKSNETFKILTRKSLKKDEIIKFFSEYVIIIDDNRGNGIVTYYFEEDIYKRYKNLILISEDYWKISKLGDLIIFNDNQSNIWKIQPSKINTITIKKNILSVGILHDFLFENKTNYYLHLEEKRIKDLKSN
tara:strand:- start:44 stop:526 length:483 start_codon:yes stop_codon:yes gene_type:complete